jgi:hypothetical protein
MGMRGNSQTELKKMLLILLYMKNGLLFHMFSGRLEKFKEINESYASDAINPIPDNHS